MYFLQPDGARTHYETWDVGLNTGRDALFLHGNLASNRWWLPLLSHLPQTQTSSRAIVAEWRGCGLSSAPHTEEELHPKALATDMKRLVDEVCDASNPIDVVGHSTGGIIAICLALLCPEKISRLVLIDAVGPQGVQFEPDFLKVFDSMRLNRDVCAQVLLSTVYGIDTNTAFFSALVDDAMCMAEINWRGVLKQLSDINLTTELPRVTCPVLILQGEHDEVCPLGGAHAYRDHLPQSQLMVLSDRGHCPIVEEPARIAEIVTEFLRS